MLCCKKDLTFLRMLAAVFVLMFLASVSADADSEDSPEIFTDQFVVRITGGPEVAKELARKHGFTYLSKMFDDHYHLKHRKLSKRSLEPSEEHHTALSQEPQVTWFSQQKLLRRPKRDFKEDTKGIKTNLNDPRWPQMWYLNRGEGLDMNVQDAWAQGVTGKGIVVTILDDGLEKDHPDISKNYDKDASYDVNNHDGDPQPRYDIIDSNRHGTRCAGEVAANANNSICAVGVAYEALVGGVRMLDGDVTDAVEAQSLSLNPEHIDIYSASWGPDDDGKTVDGPGPLASTAFKEGILKGRNGLGSIFVWASGNGGREHDNCNCDGYTNSMWTLSISSATENGLVPWYSEACSSTLATTYSSGSNGERQIVTTDLHHGCTSTHTGTSASAPLAAGICALALEANKKLTWRDMQHIVVRTARRANLHAKDWKTNGVGRNVSHSFGYGLMDAGAMVRLARKWNTAPVQKLCEIRSDHADKLIPAKSHVELSLYVRCEHVRFLEHVQAKLTLTATRRGDIHIYLTSPSGTRSTLLAQRPIDGSRAGFQSWPFMTVHNWGENPDGLWKLEVHNEGRFYGRATLKEWYLHLYGTTEDPGSQPTTPAPPTTTPAPRTTEKATTLPSVATSTTKPRSTKLKVPLWPEPTAQYYPLTTAKVQVYPLEEDNPKADGTNSLSPSNKKQEKPDTECPRGQFYYQGYCVLQCPSGHYGSAVSNYRSTHELTTSACLPCHYSCVECHGPNDYQCVLCHGDALLVDGYCEPKVMVDEVRSFTTWNDVVVGVFTALCFITLALTIYVVVAFWPPPCWKARKTGGDYVSVEQGPSPNQTESLASFLPKTSPNSTSNNVIPYYDSDEEL
ncbi:furin-like protease kpc-1 isoform X2 [Uloborus diversus]|uniref:furin-like protease kpc-1 isoform X2 n=1 Tax=Uloborus diversus TaxID=327109 RepID=UPI0024091AD0|nr:furin-like protease kpc-1 isoform X2 [Uloborus diversus]